MNLPKLETHSVLNLVTPAPISEETVQDFARSTADSLVAIGEMGSVKSQAAVADAVGILRGMQHRILTEGQERLSRMLIEAYTNASYPPPAALATLEKAIEDCAARGLSIQAHKLIGLASNKTRGREVG